MSFLVLHMDKFKKEAVRGIQSHNRRERESHSNPDIDYERSTKNYDLHEHTAENYGEAIQNRIDDLLLVKAVRKDAVHMCGLIVSSDSAFFEKLSPEDTRRFFEESKAFLIDFVGAGNVISAMVHMDEKTPHMHFLHVPVTQDGRLNANKIYTRDSLKNLQAELPAYLQSCSFDLQRGVEQVPGAAKKHLDTREFKQQQEAHNEKLKAENDKLQTQVKELRDKILGIELQHAEERQKINADIRNLSSTNQNLLARLEETEKFFRWNTTAAMMRNDYEREQRQEAQRKAEEQKRLAQEREQRERQQQEERARQAKEQERQKALEAERQRQEREQQRAQQMEQPRQGMRMR